MASSQRCLQLCFLLPWFAFGEVRGRFFIGPVAEFRYGETRYPSGAPDRMPALPFCPGPSFFFCHICHLLDLSLCGTPISPQLLRCAFDILMNEYI